MVLDKQLLFDQFLINNNNNNNDNWPKSLKSHFLVKTFHRVCKLKSQLITQYTNQR